MTANTPASPRPQEEPCRAPPAAPRPRRPLALLGGARRRRGAGRRPPACRRSPAGHRPGPDALYAAAAARPAAGEHRRRGGPRRSWCPARRPTATASGSTRTTCYDDHGAKGVVDPDSPYGPGAHLYSPTAGTATYPTDPVYANNAADLVELRVRPLAGRHRVPRHAQHPEGPGPHRRDDRARRRPDARAWPHGAGVSSPGAAVPDLARHDRRAARRRHRRRPAGRADRDRRPAPPPGRAARPARGLGPARRQGPHHRRRRPVGPGRRHATSRPRPARPPPPRPGGGTPTGAALFNVGPRTDEPLPDGLRRPTWRTPPSPRAVAGDLVARAAAGHPADPAATSRRSPAIVDFGKLRDRVRDDRGVPTHRPDQPDPRQPARLRAGPRPDARSASTSRAASRPAPRASGATSASSSRTRCTCRERPAPARGFGMTLLLHSLSANHNQYTGSAQPAPARRARRRARSCSRRAGAGPTASTPASPRPTPSRPGPTSPATTGSTRTGRRSAATRWAASAPSGCSPAGPTCSPAASPSSARRARSPTSSRACATRRCCRGTRPRTSWSTSARPSDTSPP